MRAAVFTPSFYFVVASSFLALAACSAPQAKPPVVANEPQGVERYFPLIDKHLYTYELSRDDTAVKDMLMLRVRRHDATTAALHVNEVVRSLVITPTEIRRESGGVILRAPLQVGATWPGDNGGQTKLVQTDVAIEVPAGKYQGCLRTVEEVGEGTYGRVTTTFCPLVGIVEMLTEERSTRGEVTQRTALRSFGPPVDLGGR